MRVLGIDPGTAIVGYGVVDKEGSSFKMIAYGAILTNAGTADALRLEQVYDQLNDILNLYKPDIVVIEKLFFNTNSKTAIQVGQARGVILLACQKKNLEMAEYTPLQVKSAIVGYGRAEKKQIQLMVKSILKLKEIPKPDDSADALALAICHFQFNTNLYNLIKKK